MSWSSNAEQIYRKRPFSGGSIMIWGCVTIGGSIHLQRIKKTMNSDVYCKMLGSHIISKLGIENPSFIMQQDNARPHTSKKSIALLYKVISIPDFNSSL